MKKEIKLEIDLEKFRYSLVGDGCVLEEVQKMSEEELVLILEDRINWHIEKEYRDGKIMRLYDELKNDNFKTE